MAHLDLTLFFEPVPSENERALYDKFIEEYIKDYNAVEAAQRVGFAPTFAIEYSKIFLTKPYIQREIMRRRLEKPIESDKEIVERDKQMMISSMREVIQNGPFQTRVAATKVLAGIHGIDQSPDRSAEELQTLIEAFKDVAKALPE